MAHDAIPVAANFLLVFSFTKFEIVWLFNMKKVSKGSVTLLSSCLKQCSASVDRNVINQNAAKHQNFGCWTKFVFSGFHLSFQRVKFYLSVSSLNGFEWKVFATWLRNLQFERFCAQQKKTVQKALCASCASQCGGQELSVWGQELSAPSLSSLCCFSLSHCRLTQHRKWSFSFGV